MLIEHLYDYPRRFTWPLEALSAALVGLATLNFGRAVINFGLQQRPLLSMVNQLALLRPILRWFQTTGGPVTSAAGLLPSLLWLLLALFVTQFLRNMLPTVRTQRPRHAGPLERRLGAGAVDGPPGAQNYRRRRWA